MANVILKAYDSKGELIETLEADSSEAPTMKKKAESAGYKVEVTAPLTEEEYVSAYPPVSPGQGFRGGILQGLSLGTEDEVFGNAEKRMQQEAEQPLPYTAGKAIGGIIPGAAAGAAGGFAGAMGGAKLGGMLGAAGGPIGAAGGATIGGLLGAAGGGALASGIESYMSQPSGERSVEQAAEDAAISGALGLIPGIPIISRAKKGISSLLAPATKKIEELAEEVPKIKVLSQKAWEEAKDIGKKTFADDLLPAQRSVIHKNLLQKVMEKQKLDKQEQEILKTITTAEAGVLAAEFGIPMGAIQSLVQGAIGMQSPEELAVLNRQAAARAFEEAQRRKTERLMADAEAEAAVRSGVEERNIERMKKLSPKKKK